jgi:hypothetical protein
MAIKFYTRGYVFKSNEKELSRREVESLFLSALDELDLDEYKDMIIQLESNMCKNPSDLKIDFDTQQIENDLGKCTFRDFSSGLKNFLAYVYIGQVLKPLLEESGDDTIPVLNITSMGNNIIKYLIIEMDKFSIPVFVDSFILNFSNAKESNGVFNQCEVYLNDVRCKSYWEFFGMYDKIHIKAVEGDLK